MTGSHRSIRCMNGSRGAMLCWLVAVSTLAGGCVEQQEAPMTMSEQVVRVAVCQTLCIDGDREGNFRRIENALEVASAQGAELACFPEAAILGWVNPDAHRLAYPIPGSTSDRIARLARQHNMMIAIGLAEADGDELYDSAILVDVDGRLLLKHRKINTIAELMDPPYTRGTPDEIKVVETGVGRIGMLICADTFVENLVRKIGAKSPDLLIVPFGWAAKKQMWPAHGKKLAETVSRAAQWADCPVIGTDLVGIITHGPWTGRAYGGQSVVADCDGEVLAVLRDRDVEVRVLEVPIRPAIDVANRAGASRRDRSGRPPSRPL